MISIGFRCDIGVPFGIFCRCFFFCSKRFPLTEVIEKCEGQGLAAWIAQNRGASRDNSPRIDRVWIRHHNAFSDRANTARICKGSESAVVAKILRRAARAENYPG